MKKIFVTLVVLLSAFNFVSAEMTVEELRSEETLKNAGYSDYAVSTVQKGTGEYVAKPLNKWQRYGFKIWNYLEPSSPEPNDAGYHQIRRYNHYEDL